MLLLYDSAVFWAGLVVLLPFPATSLTTITATWDCLPDQVPFNASCLPVNVTYAAAYQFLQSNLPSWDRANAATLGFHGAEPEVDGLDAGVATLGINISLVTKQTWPWAAAVPQQLAAAATRVIQDTGNEAGSVGEVVRALNSNMWTSKYLGHNVTFKSSQTPLIFDPMSTLVFGYASCTGISILFADALRAAGVAARLAGTPAWHGDPSQWFCTPDRMRNTRVFAARWSRDTEQEFPLAWDAANKEVPGLDRTEFYRTVCSEC